MPMNLSHERWIEEDDKLESLDVSKMCSFGISVLDDALTGIMPNDLIVIGADSGSGKSEVALDIAVHNAENGKRVALYFIEGGSGEAINRIRWKKICRKYYDEKHTSLDMDYRKWRMGMLKSPLMRELSFKCLNEHKQKVGDRLHVYDFKTGMTIGDFEESLGYFLKPQGDPDDLLNYAHEVDLIIIDHLQYFTLVNPKNELTEMTQILTKVRQITIDHNIPVVLVSHLRKKDKDRGIPNQEDFFGTSNIPKQSSISITMSAYYLADQYLKDIYPTFFRFVKSRTGIRQSIAALCNFDFKLGQYEKDYAIYKLLGDKPASEPLPKHELPKWAYEGFLRREKAKCP